MNRSFRLSTALDVDDLLLECVPYAIRLANEKYKFDPPISIYEVDRWGKLGTRADVIFEFFEDSDREGLCQKVLRLLRGLSRAV